MAFIDCGLVWALHGRPPGWKRNVHKLGLELMKGSIFI